MASCIFREIVSNIPTPRCCLRYAIYAWDGICRSIFNISNIVIVTYSSLLFKIVYFYTEIGKVTFKSNGDKAISNDDSLKSNKGEAFNAE